MAKIQVVEEWRGIHSDGMLITVGTYEHDSPELFNALPYLVENGMAKWIDPPPAKISDEPIEIEFDDMTLAEIDTWMTENGVEKPSGWSNLNRDARIFTLENILHSD